MKEIEANRKAWDLLAQDHYNTFSERLKRQENLLNEIVIRELGDISGKSLIHLQCNTGADTVCLARMGARVTGVDLAPENVHFAQRLARENGFHEAVFIESDIMQLMQVHDGKYDVVFTSEGALGWLPDLGRWGQTVRHLLKDDGFLYVFDSHPFQLAFAEEQMADGILEVRYPYFGSEPDADPMIGGYASAPKQATNHFWVYTISDLVNSLSDAGLYIEFFNEYDVLYWDLGGMEQVSRGLYRFPHFAGQLPFVFSLGARVR